MRAIWNRRVFLAIPESMKIPAWCMMCLASGILLRAFGILRIPKNPLSCGTHKHRKLNMKQKNGLLSKYVSFRKRAFSGSTSVWSGIFQLPRIESRQHRYNFKISILARISPISLKCRCEPSPPFSRQSTGRRMLSWMLLGTRQLKGRGSTGVSTLPSNKR